jgi:transcriptional regulator with XRE-family HTH domain
MVENRLRTLRKSNGLTQVRLAEKAHVSRSVIARFETGRTELSTKNLMKIANALDCGMEEIVNGGHTDGKIAECV